MNLNETTKTSKNALPVISLPFAVAALFIGLAVSEFTNHRQYTPESIKTKDAGIDAGVEGMNRFFFDARRDPITHQMDYKSMLASDNLNEARRNERRAHSVNNSLLPNFNWVTLGPTNIGGRTRAILIDNNDPTHQTIFAGGVSGGIWKSTNGGSTWGNTFNTLSFSQNDNMENLNIACITQDANGVIYVGTGESFPGSQTQLGDGIFTSNDDGTTWTQMPSTKPASVNNASIAWSYVNRIAIQPNNPSIIYAATNLGVYISHNGGTTWGPAVKKVGNVTTSMWKNNSLYNCYDVEISKDGSIVVAGIGSGCYTYLCYTGTNDSLFIEAASTGVGHINGNASRIEYAISPTDPNRIYASEIASNGSFCQNRASGIYMCENAVSSGNGGYWYLIGPGGSIVFDPYVEPFSTDDQATYDNTLGVSYADEGELFAGGTTLSEWHQNGASDTVGYWTTITHYGIDNPYDPLSVHADMHTLVFDSKDNNIFYIGCDGGVYKSSNIQAPDSAKIFASYNRNYDVTQYYTLCFAPFVNFPDTPIGVPYGNSYKLEGLGVGGGTQDNGSPYINGYGASPNNGTDMSSGDGAGSAVSQLNPNIAYFCSDNGSLFRIGNLGNLSGITTAYTKTKGPCDGGDIDTVAAAASLNGAANFTFPVALYENSFDTLNSDSVPYIFLTNDTLGQIIYPAGINGTYPYALPKAHSIGDTINVPDRIVSRLAIGFSGSQGGIWINGQGASGNTVIWKPIGGPDSKPDAFTSSNSFDSPHALAWSPNGDALFVGTEEGALFRFSNINKVVSSTYCSGALWWSEGGIHATGDTTVKSKKLTFAGLNGADILSIDVDPKNGNNVLVTIGGYGGAGVENVWLSTNALGNSPTFKSVQGTGASALPPMPVYSAILDVLDSDGSSITGSAMVATEHGVYATANINATPVVWQSNNSGMANCLSFVIKQQTWPIWLCNNPSTIYLATFGRGLWNATDLTKILTKVPPVVADATKNNLLVYPNPMTTEGNVSFNLANADNVTLTIYDMQGKVVKETAMGTQAPGSHIVPFGTNGLQAGTYFAALTGTDFRKVSKFVVIK